MISMLVAVEILFPVLVITLPEPRRDERVSSFKSSPSLAISLQLS